MQIKLSEISIIESIEKFNQLNLRLRIMLTIAGITVLFMMFDLMWFSSQNALIKQLESDISKKTQQIDNLINQQQAANMKAVNRKNNTKTLKLKKLTHETDIAYQKLAQKTVNLVQPKDMASVLKKIISSTSSLTIISLLKNQTEEIINESSNHSNSNQKDNVKLYRHSIKMVLTGDYNSTYQFLKKLENMKQKLSFDQFDYLVETHPKAEIKLQVSTISLKREWIGG